MALKDTWIDLENAVEGVENSGSDASADDINAIAQAVIELEVALKKLSDAGISVDLSNYYTKDETDSSLKLKEDVSNKITYEKINGKLDDISLYTDENYLSAYVSYILHDGIAIEVNKLSMESENRLSKTTVIDETANDINYPSTQAVKTYVDTAIQSAILDSWEVEV